MNPLRHYPILASLLKPFRRSQQKSCAALVAALCQAAQASSFAIAGQLACITQVQFGSALTRLYRFLRHTFASRLLERGERETDINKILGHSKLRMTTKYLHSSAESRRRAAESLSQVCHKEERKVAVFGHK